MPDLTKLYPPFKAKIDALQVALGPSWRITSAYRSPEEQDKLYAQGRTTPGAIVTNARGTPPQSYHLLGLACDWVKAVNGKADWSPKTFDALGVEARKIGLEWGGAWKFLDLPHTQASGLKLTDLQREFAKGGLVGVWKFLGTLK